jgi:hypothetical protein
MHRKTPALLSRVVEPYFTYSWLLVISTQVAWFPTSYHPPTLLEMTDTMLISYRTWLAVPFSWSYSDIFTGLWKTSLRKSDFMFSIVCSVLVSSISYPLPPPRRYSLTTYNTPHRRWMFYLHRFLCLHHTSTPFTIYIHHDHLHLHLSPHHSSHSPPYAPIPHSQHHHHLPYHHPFLLVLGFSVKRLPFQGRPWPICVPHFISWLRRQWRKIWCKLGRPD